MRNSGRDELSAPKKPNFGKKETNKNPATVTTGQSSEPKPQKRPAPKVVDPSGWTYYVLNDGVEEFEPPKDEEVPRPAKPVYGQLPRVSTQSQRFREEPVLRLPASERNREPPMNIDAPQMIPPVVPKRNVRKEVSVDRQGRQTVREDRYEEAPLLTHQDKNYQLQSQHQQLQGQLALNDQVRRTMNDMNQHNEFVDSLELERYRTQMRHEDNERNNQLVAYKGNLQHRDNNSQRVHVENMRDIQHRDNNDHRKHIENLEAMRYQDNRNARDHDLVKYKIDHIEPLVEAQMKVRKRYAKESGKAKAKMIMKSERLVEEDKLRKRQMIEKRLSENFHMSFEELCLSDFYISDRVNEQYLRDTMQGYYYSQLFAGVVNMIIDRGVLTLVFSSGDNYKIKLPPNTTYKREVLASGVIILIFRRQMEITDRLDRCPYCPHCQTQ